MRSRVPDRLCAEAVGLALAAAEEAAGPGGVGEHLGAVADGDRVVTHSFACKEPAYRGWRWAVTLARASRSRQVTVDESVLLPGPEAVLAPDWVPWSERLRPGDLGAGDLLPTADDDPRLEPGWTGADQPPPNSVLASPPEPAPAPEPVPPPEPAAPTEATGTPAEPTAPAEPTVTPTEPRTVLRDVPAPSVGTVAAVAEEIGVRRARVLSRYGLTLAAERWEEQFGPRTPIGQAAPAHCATCGFLVPVAGSLRQAFGLCANVYSPADGHVVSLAFGCGAHSEAAVVPRPAGPAEPVLDEMRDVEQVTLHPGAPAAAPDTVPEQPRDTSVVDAAN